MVRNSSGFICAPMTNEIADRLDLPPDGGQQPGPARHRLHRDASTPPIVSAPASAPPTARTRCACSPIRDSTPTSLFRPGHILPLRAVDGGVRERDGHTEAAVDLLKLAGLTPVAAIAEIVDDSGEMMRLPGLLELGEREDVPVITIEDLIRFMEERECEDDPERGASRSPSVQRVSFEVETTVPDRARRLRACAPTATARPAPTTSRSSTGRCSTAPSCACTPSASPVRRSARSSASADRSWMRRSTASRPRAASSSTCAATRAAASASSTSCAPTACRRTGFDTLDANLALGFPADARDYGAATAILRDLGLSSVRLLSNNPEKRRQLEERGITVTELVPLVVGVGADNEGYLDTKRDRMGHCPAVARTCSTRPCSPAATEGTRT